MNVLTGPRRKELSKRNLNRKNISLMPGRIILSYNHGWHKEERYESKDQRRKIIRRWVLNHQLTSKQHYITIIPDEDETGEFEVEYESEIYNRD